MGFLTRRVKHQPVAMPIYRLTGGRARFSDSNGVRIPPITGEAIPHLLGELRWFAMLRASALADHEGFMGSGS